MSEIHRYIEGGNADYQAGCALSGFDLSPSIRVTNKLSVKADTNSISVSWRPYPCSGSTFLRELLASIGPLRFFHKSEPAHQRRGYWTTVAGFYQPEHALIAIRRFSGLPKMEARLLYTVYFTAPKELSDAVLLDVEEIASQIPEVAVTWEEPKGGKVNLRISGSQQEKVIDIKQILEAIYSGRVATASGRQGITFEIWSDFFTTPQGYIWLQHLSRDTGTIVASDKSQCRLRIYHPEGKDKQIRFIEGKLMEKMTQLNAFVEVHTINLDKEMFKKLIASDTIKQAQNLLGKGNVSLDVVKKTLALHCTRDKAWSITYELGLPLPPPAVQESQKDCSMCGEVTSHVQFSCSHVSCKECFNHQLNVACTDLTSHHFPIVCWHENCQQPIAIAELRKYASGTIIDSLFKASLTYYIRSRPDVYRNCRKPDCQSVYLRDGPYEIFTCATCLTQTCTKCHNPPHVGWTCTEYEIQIARDQVNENLLEEYKVRAGTKDCPKCKTLIEKVDGCNHVECSGCHVHICWVCLKYFRRLAAAYDHLDNLHGGNGLDESDIEDDSDFSSEEEEEDDEDEDDEEFEDEDEVYEGSDDGWYME